MGSVEGPAQPQPRNLAQALSDSTRTIQPSDCVPVQRYVHLARTLLNQASKYERVANQEQQYVMLLRFASLILETIPQHPEFHGSAGMYARMKQQLGKYYLPKMETLKGMLSQRQIMETPTGPAHPRPEDIWQIGASNLPELDWGVGGTTAAFPAAPRLPQYGGMTASPGQPHAGGMAPPPDIMINSTFTARSRSVNRHGLLGSPYDTSNSTLGGTALVGAGAASAAIGVQYPTIDAPSAPPVHSTSGALPSAPALEGRMQQASLMDAAPIYSPSGFPASNAVAPRIGPHLELQLGPQEMQVHTVAAPALTEVMHPGSEAASPNIVPTTMHGVQREVHISQEMLEIFLEVAKMNTQRSIETCALLAGELVAERSLLQVTKLIFPKQKGHTDRVEMMNEEEIVDEVLGDDLIIMGWIHTHPEFDCFLSSIDVHTTMSYQLMLPEAIAIVMAPKDQRRKCGIFRLTTPGGMDVVKECKLRGFHTHRAPSTGQDIYEVCQHVYLNPRLRVSCRDLR